MEFMWAVLGLFGAPVGRSWGSLGAVFGTSGAVFGFSWAVLRPPWPSGQSRGAVLGHIGAL